MDFQPPTNDLIERLIASLSPRAREIHEELRAAIEAGNREELSRPEVEAHISKALSRADVLLVEDRRAFMRIEELSILAYDLQIEERHREFNG
jgi:hypothetical protein